MPASASGKRKDAKVRGTLFVISAPSGAGKTTLCKKLLKRNQDLKLSVSYTTREPRKGETNDVDYTFINKKRFMNMVDKGEFAEWAMVHGNLYGTSLKRLRSITRQGHDIILDIDIHGALQLRKNYQQAVFIFILPPSLNILKERLVKRRTDAKEAVARRLDNARDEIAYYTQYDYVIVNDRLDKAYKELESIIISDRLRTARIDKQRMKRAFKMTK